MNIVIPMAGAGSRFSKQGYLKPKPFIDVMGKPMIVRVMENLAFKNAKFILILRKEHLEMESTLINDIKEKFNVVFIPIEKLTEGAACTILYARKHINNDQPLLLANSDQIVQFSLENYITECDKKEANGSILTFIDKERDPKWSFAQLDTEGYVTKVKEKEAISEYATVGLYYFKKGRDYVNYAIDMIIENDRSNNEFYTCPVYNYAIKDGKKIVVHNIDHEYMHGIGTPEDLNKFLHSNPLNY
ncbi:lipopolysaccharide biosynthesis protein [Sediminicola sp. YIK13]|nr:lipopolysaccharide biosynthesis protein [Sediminicola sp. YIK13]